MFTCSEDSLCQLYLTDFTGPLHWKYSEHEILRSSVAGGFELNGWICSCQNRSCPSYNTVSWLRLNRFPRLHEQNVISLFNLTTSAQPLREISKVLRPWQVHYNWISGSKNAPNIINTQYHFGLVSTPTTGLHWCPRHLATPRNLCPTSERGWHGVWWR